MASAEHSEVDGSQLAGRGSLPEEVLEAFGPERKIRAAGSKSYLTWLYQQCQTAAGVGGERAVEDDKSEVKLLHKLFTGDRSKLNFMEKQTYAKWKSMMAFEKVKHPMRHRRKVVLIQPISWKKCHRMSAGQEKDGSKEGKGVEVGYGHTQISGAVLELLRQFCSAFYLGMEIKVSPSLDLSDIPKLTSRIHQLTNRRQFMVGGIVNFLRKHRLKNCYCILGVTVVDLYPGPEWNFVLGQASLENGCGVFSFGRYFNSGVASVRGGLVEDMPPVPPESGCGNKMEAETLQAEQMKNIWVLMRVS